jgi:hypothetical protein
MSPLRTVGILTLVLAAGTGAAWITLHAAERPDAPPAATPAALPPLPDAGTIKDDPTVAPDPKQSADNNVSLPADI